MALYPGQDFIANKGGNTDLHYIWQQTWLWHCIINRGRSRERGCPLWEAQVCERCQLLLGHQSLEQAGHTFKAIHSSYRMWRVEAAALKWKRVFRSKTFCCILVAVTRSEKVPPMSPGGVARNQTNLRSTHVILPWWVGGVAKSSSSLLPSPFSVDFKLVSSVKTAWELVSWATYCHQPIKVMTVPTPPPLPFPFLRWEKEP